MDALIVATASVAGATVLTRDRRLAEVLAAESEFELYG
jgi:predicted nucleic acid-binding protein